MSNIIKSILNWSEVWALLIPLAIYILKRNQPRYLNPVIFFLFISLLINLFIDLLADYKKVWGLEEGDFLWNNNFLYNLSSIIRLVLFAWFFNLLDQKFMQRVKTIIPYGFLLFVLVNFIFFENFFPMTRSESFSSRLLATEAALLIFFCLQYFIYLIIEDKTTNLKSVPGFWVVTGLSIYVGASFFIYLFYEYLTKKTMNFAVNIWDVHNIVFIIFCIFIAVQFHMENKKLAT